MSPGGHLVTTAAACAVAAAHQQWGLMVGLAAGGFLIDVDHAVDYVLVERQRDLRPGTFLRHYTEGQVRRTVLALHSWELFALLLVLAWSSGAPWLVGYVAGGLMHLSLDLVYNGRYTPHSIVLFYSFTYRALHRFDAARLLGETPLRPVRQGFWHAFFGTTEASATVLDSTSGHAGARRRG
ncbi:MAG TPA: hypothetical protein VN646_02400 [Candidatus Acidoferrum sp.]|jgi:hypothetical protein|nr:hypothetical protein [Candidatus Acidoferrum sp.]